MPGLAAVSLGLVVALVLVARPTHELPPLPPVVAALPPSASVALEPAVAPSAPVVEASPARVARPHSARAAVRPVRTARHSLAVEPVRTAWPDPSALSRLVVHVSSAPYRTLVPRDMTQSP